MVTKYLVCELRPVVDLWKKKIVCAADLYRYVVLRFKIATFIPDPNFYFRDVWQNEPEAFSSLIQNLLLMSVIT